MSSKLYQRFADSKSTFIVAELSANHVGRLDVVLDLIAAVAAAGADAFKIQTLIPEAMTINADNECFLIAGGTPWDGRKLIDLYSETPLPYEWHEAIFEHCSEVGLICFSTPYDKSTADFVNQFDPPLYKVSSFEITDIQLIQHIATFRKPILLSTGVADLQDIEAAVSACREVGNDEIVLLKCTSAYPAPLNEVNLRTMMDMASRFHVPVGISDHTLGNETAVASVACGGCIVEKHVTLDRALGGPDASFSINPYELTELVRRVRDTEVLLGNVTYDLSESSEKSRMFARSLFFVRDIKCGEVVTEAHIRSIRPGHGLKPACLPGLVGRRVLRDISRGTPTSWDQFDE